MKAHASGYINRKSGRRKARRKNRNDDSHVKNVVSRYSKEEISAMEETNHSRISAKQTDRTGRGIFRSTQFAIHAKMEISQPGDASEVQADAFADSFMSGNADRSNQVLSHNTSDISRSSDREFVRTTNDFDTRMLRMKGSGHKLDDEAREELEAHSGTDLGEVNIHGGPEADALNQQVGSLAFAHGQDIFFGQGQYNPDSETGKKLIAHEVAHTVQDEGSHLMAKIKRQVPPTGNGDGFVEFKPPRFFTVQKVEDLMEAPGQNSIGIVDPYVTVKLLWESDTWYFVELGDGRDGYLSKASLNITKSQTNQVTNTNTNEGEKAATELLVSFMLTVSVSAGDPQGEAYEQYLQQVYGKSPTEAKDISTKRGPTNRFTTFTAATITKDKNDQPIAQKRDITVTPRRYLQNLYGDDILKQDTRLLEDYLLGRVNDPASKTLQLDYSALNGFLSTLKDAPTTTDLLNAYEFERQKYESAFQGYDRNISDNYLAWSMVYNPKLVVKPDNTTIVGQGLEDARTKLIKAQIASYPILQGLGSHLGNTVLEEYIIQYDGTSYTGAPDYRTLASSVIGNYATYYSADLLKILEKELIWALEERFLTQGANVKTPAELLAGIDANIKSIQESADYKSYESAKNAVGEYYRLSMTIAEESSGYAAFIADSDSAYWATDLEKRQYEANYIWPQFVLPKLNDPRFEELKQKYPSVTINWNRDAFNNSYLESPGGISIDTVARTANLDENIANTARYLNSVQSNRETARQALRVDFSGNSSAIPLKAVIVIDNAPYPLALYLLKDNNEWKFIDVSSSAQPTETEGVKVKVDASDADHAVAIEQAWTKYTENNARGTGRMLVEKPKQFFTTASDPLWRYDNTFNGAVSDTEYRLPSFYRDPNAPKITCKVNPQGATNMATRINNGLPGFDPAYAPKNGGTMFFNSKGDAWAGLSADQTITVEVSVKMPSDVAILNDADLFKYEVDIAIDDFEKEGAKIKSNNGLMQRFKDAYYEYSLGINKNGKYDVKDFTSRLKANELGISNTVLKRLLAPLGHHKSIKARMWTKVGEFVFGTQSGVGRVQMAEGGVSPYAKTPSEYVLVRETANVSIVGGDAQFVDMMAEAGAKNSSAESMEIFKRQRGAKVRAVFRIGGKILLVVAIAQDIYAFIKAEDKLREITRIAGGWGGAYLAGTAAAALFAPADTAGPVAWVLHGLIVLVASGVGYVVGSEFTGWVYDLTIEDEGW